MKKAKPLDLSDIIESTMESVYYGHDFHKSMFGTSEDVRLPDSSPIDMSSTKSKVMLILNISKEDSWIFKSQVSAWTRILSKSWTIRAICSVPRVSTHLLPFRTPRRNELR